MSKTLRILLGLSVLCCSNFALAGTYVAVNATVTKVSNTSGNGASFAVYTVNGTGPCIGQWIVFPEADSPNPAAHQRAYSTALTALSTGMKVSIHNYISDSCTTAAYLEIRKP